MWPCIPWISRGRCILACVWYGFFSLGVLLTLFHFVSLFMFLSFSLFHLEGYRIRLNNQPVSGMLRYFESQQSSTFRGLKAIFYVIKSRFA